MSARSSKRANLAVMDTRDLRAQLKPYQEIGLQAQHTLEQAEAKEAQQQAALTLAPNEIERTSFLVPKGFATVQTVHRHKQQLEAAIAALRANDAAEHAVAAA